ncbi:MAG: YfhO family protein [Ruminococcus sp.]|nr:YfhO family protein [Ruminococcus sp.]
MTKQKEKYLKVFLLTFLTCGICFLPIVALNGGRFFYYADYNKQQIMFYTHLHDLVRGGLPQWDPAADLGSDTAAAYSFYLLGSPFFWLSTLLPSGLVIAAMPWLIALKASLASLGAYGYIRRFCENTTACAAGAVLFGLSSYNSANLLFNHFHDAVLMLPFLLWGLECLLQEGRRGPFAVAVALAAFTSYYFFFGQVIFIILYFLVAVFTGHFKLTPRRFGLLALESVLGTLCASVLLLPSAMSVINNPRVSDLVHGSGLFVYRYKSTYLYILQNMLGLPSIPLIRNFGAERANELDSNSFASFIHFFSLTGIVAWFRSVKGRDFFKVLLGACGVFMLVPVLNQSFSFFNAAFYGRWFYMPLLIGCAVTAKALELWQEEKLDLKRGYLPTVIVTAAALCVELALVLLSKNGVIKLGFENYTYAYIQIAFTAFSLGMLGLVLYKPESPDRAVMLGKMFTRALVFCGAGMCLVVWCSYFFRGLSEMDYMTAAADYAASDDRLPEGEYYRLSSSPNLMNMPVVWGYDTVRYFNSTVEPSVTEFYSTADIERVAKSSYEPSHYPLMALLSVKYYVDDPYYDSNGDIKPIDPELAGTHGTYTAMYQKHGLNFYENTRFIPMGFTFDKYTTEADISGQNELIRSASLLEALVLTDEQAERYSHILERYDPTEAQTVFARYEEICEERRSSAAKSFAYTDEGFTAEIDLPRENLVFFSVPYSRWWRAEVNGREVEIEKVDGGLMAVPCAAGESEIFFTYKNGYLAAGRVITIIAAAALCLYILLPLMIRRKRKE